MTHETAPSPAQRRQMADTFHMLDCLDAANERKAQLDMILLGEKSVNDGIETFLIVRDVTQAMSDAIGFASR